MEPLPEQPPRPAKRRGIRRWIVHGVLLVVGILLIVLAARRVDPKEIVANLGKLSLSTIALAFVAYLVAWGLRIWRLWFLAREADAAVTPRQAIATALGANALNIIAPARLGDISAFVHLRHLTAKGAQAAATILTWRLTDLGALLTVALLAGLPILLLIPLADGRGLVWAMAGGALFLVAAALAAFAARNHKWRALLDRLAARLLGSRAPRGAAFGQATLQLLAPGVFLFGLALAIGAWIADAAFAAIILHSLWPGNPVVVFVPMVLANAAKTLPSTPGGVGVYELVFATALQQYGVDAATALTLGIVTHALLNGWTLLLGAPGAIAIGRSVSKSAAR